MKKSHSLVRTVLLGAAFALSGNASAAVLLGFHTFLNASNASEPHDVAATFFTGTVTKNTDSRSGGGSNDNLYGNSSLATPTATADGFLRMVGGNFTLTANYSAAATSSMSLTALYFDATTTTGAGNLTVAYRINGGTSMSLTPAAIVMVNTTASDSIAQPYEDYGLAFAGATLNPGDSIEFTFNVSGVSGSARLDNIALVGDVIPEPATVMLLSGFGAVSLLRRNRRA